MIRYSPIIFILWISGNPIDNNIYAVYIHQIIVESYGFIQLVSENGTDILLFSLWVLLNINLSRKFNENKLTYYSLSFWILFPPKA